MKRTPTSIILLAFLLIQGQLAVDTKQFLGDGQLGLNNGGLPFAPVGHSHIQYDKLVQTVKTMQATELVYT